MIGKKIVKNIELDAPNVSKLEKEYICRCIDSGFVSTFGAFVPEFGFTFNDIMKDNFYDINFELEKLE